MQRICFITIVHIYYFLLNRSLWTILSTKCSGTLYSVPHTSLRMHKRYHLALYPELGSWGSFLSETLENHNLVGLLLLTVYLKMSITENQNFTIWNTKFP